MSDAMDSKSQQTQDGLREETELRRDAVEIVNNPAYCERDFFGKAALNLAHHYLSHPQGGAVVPESRCTLYQDQEGSELWETTCGAAWHFDDEPTANDIKFCSRCGKPCDIEPWKENDDETESPTPKGRA